jgi:hypothetical protein
VSQRAKLSLTVLVLAVAAMLLAGGGSIGASAPPFKADRLCVLVVEESENRGKLSSGQLDAIAAVGPGSVRWFIEGNGGEYQVLDKDDGEKLTYSPQWVKDAFALPRQGEPWIHAANPHTGCSVPLLSAGDALSKLESMGGK